jgi:hypothetical protein
MPQRLDQTATRRPCPTVEGKSAHGAHPQPAQAGLEISGEDCCRGGHVLPIA